LKQETKRFIARKKGKKMEDRPEKNSYPEELDAGEEALVARSATRENIGPELGSAEYQFLQDEFAPIAMQFELLARRTAEMNARVQTYAELLLTLDQQISGHYQNGYEGLAQRAERNRATNEKTYNRLSDEASRKAQEPVVIPDRYFTKRPAVAQQPAQLPPAPASEQKQDQ
jgi:hypothetical protein